MYAHVTEGVVDQVGGLPRLVFQDGRWWDLRTLDPATLAEVGWYEVAMTERPPDTATTTWEDTYTFDAGTVTQVWTERDKTQQELDLEQEQAAVAAFEEAQAALVTANLALSEQAHEDGQAWVQPTGAHDAYPVGAQVTHGGKTWENLTPFNVWEPGVSGWREVVEDGYPEWIRPTGAHDAYNTGDRVSFEGSDYESLIDGNTWSPTEYPQGWRKL